MAKQPDKNDLLDKFTFALARKIAKKNNEPEENVLERMVAISSKKQPDRWERMALDVVTDRPWSEKSLQRGIAQLLRQQHQAFVRIVQAEQKLCDRNAGIGGYNGVSEGWIARAAQCSDILSTLNERAK